jgi:hypothetical protein
MDNKNHEQAVETSMTVPSSSEQATPPKVTLCATCKSIDWHAIANYDGAMQESFWSGTRIENFMSQSSLERTQEAKDVACSVCDFFAAVWGVQDGHLLQNSETKNSAHYMSSENLVSLARGVLPLADYAFWIFKDCHGFRGSPFLNAIGIRCSNNKRCFSPRAVNPESIDFDVVKSWIDQSFARPQHEYGRQCVEPKTFLPKFRVIFCRSKQIIEASSGCTYVALSYVWGANQASRHLDDEGNIIFPTTISDAITVCQILGFKYLWVDRYVSTEQTKC